MKRPRKLKRHMAKPKPPTVAVTFNCDPVFKAEFEKERKKHGRFATNTDFWVAAMASFVFQTRRGEMPIVPIEFVTEPRPKQ